MVKTHLEKSFARPKFLNPITQLAAAGSAQPHASPHNTTQDRTGQEKREDNKKQDRNIRGGTVYVRGELKRGEERRRRWGEHVREERG